MGYLGEPGVWNNSRVTLAIVGNILCRSVLFRGPEVKINNFPGRCQTSTTDTPRINRITGDKPHREPLSV